jgi:circadian clock protein KaiC
LDELTEGGIPRNSPTLICGAAGAGKTVLAIEFIVRGALEYGEPGVYISFEESREKVARNIRILGQDWEKLARKNLVYIDYVDARIPADAEIGEFDLSALFLRLENAISKVKAKRVVIDGAEALFGAFRNESVIRRELTRLFRWLESKKVTALITSEKGDGSITRRGFEEYLADCVIYLDHRINEQISTRRLRVIKYRGAPLSTDEFPFLIDENGIWVLPLTSIGLKHEASSARVSSGIEALDAMFGGRGFYRGSSILVSGTAGTGKSSLSASFVHAACARGESALYFAFEESEQQICRNMRSIGIDLQSWVRKGLLHFETFRPTVFGLEAHLSNIERVTRDRKPSVVVIDPITNFSTLGTDAEVKNMLMRLIDSLKTRQITSMFTSLTEGGAPVENSSVGVSSLIDTWILVRDIELRGERNRGLYILKSRGMHHSNQIREFVISDRGVDLIPPYVAPEGDVYIGAARVARISAEAAAKSAASQDSREHRDQLRQYRRRALQAEIAAIKARYDAEERRLDGDHQLMEKELQRAARKAEQIYRGGGGIPARQ